MIARKKVSLSRSTGEILSEEILGTVEMTKDEYWEPFVLALGPEIIEAALKEK